MPKTILLADDSITIQKVVELTFSDGDYEVTAVNNGAKAIQKLSEMRPDIILSDIIMPEKNGYEVCEYVKSHPEYRNIPVVLLTGTFEPFDPDRADKAGCDAVVTKPFESQSLIHKVEELIEAARASAPVTAPQPTVAAAPEPAPAAAAPAPSSSQPSPWADETPRAGDLFGSSTAASTATTEMPFASAGQPGGAETRGFPSGGFGSFDSPATTQGFPAASKETSPWAEDDAPAAAPPAGETRAFPKMSFEEMQKMAGVSSEDAATSDDSPFGAPPPAESFSGETRAFPKLNFDDLSKGPSSQAAPSAPSADNASWGGSSPAPAGETRAFPRMNYEGPSGASSSESAGDDSGPAWGSTPSAPAMDEAPAPFSAPAASFDAPAEPADDEPAWSAPAAAASAQPSQSHSASTAASGGNGLDLSDDQIDRIARRVVQLMSDQVVRNIAWEVIPDMAEMVVKERIRQLENEG